MYKIPLTRPYMSQEIKDRVCEVLESGYLTEGAVTRNLENAFSEYIGCAHAIAATSCTTGLEMALRVLGIGPGDEVIVPDFTYPATADVVAIVGARIVLVDVKKETMLIDCEKIEEAITERTRAIIPVSQFGNPLDYDKLNRIKQRHGLYLVEDAACALGAEYRGVKVGKPADISVFSLHPRKFITTGEGGMITTDRKEWAEWMISYKHFGMGVQESRLKASFDRVGTNYKLSDILSAVGLAQMDNIVNLLSRRLELARNYTELLEGCEDVHLPETTFQGKHSYQSFCIFVENRDEVLARMRESGVEVQIGTYSLHMHSAFQGNPLCRLSSAMDNSVYAFGHCLALPLYHELSMNEQRFIAGKLVEIIEKIR